MEIILATSFTMLGGIFASLFTLINERIDRKEDFIKKGSYCLSCEKDLKPYHNIPFFSFLVLGGKCSYCKEKIPPQNFLNEFFLMVLFLTAFIILNSIEKMVIFLIGFVAIASLLMFLKTKGKNKKSKETGCPYKIDTL